MNYAEQWEKDGYIIIRNAFTKIDAQWIINDIQASRYNMNIDVLSEKLGRIEKFPISNPAPLSHHRITNLHSVYRKAYELAITCYPILKEIWNNNPKFLQSLAYETSSEQGLHQDWPYVACHSHKYMAGIWFALESVTEDNGPLFYYPGSHKIKRFNIKNCNFTLEQIKSYEEYLSKEVLCFNKQCFTAEAGDILIWHGDLLHGGSIAINRQATRYSMICHYTVEDLCFT